jgi:hypothetical protein
MTNASLTDTPYPITVHVTVDIYGKGTATCFPPIATPTVPNTMLDFTIVTSGWNFDPTIGSVVTSPGTQFPNPATLGTTTATLLDLNTDTSEYAYVVTVVKASTGEVVRHDPLIKNGGISTCDD